MRDDEKAGAVSPQHTFEIQGAKRSRGRVTAGKLNNDVYLRRLMADELFLGSLKNLFFNDQIVMAVQEQIEDFDSAATQETAMRFSESPPRVPRRLAAPPVTSSSMMPHDVMYK